MFLFRSLFSVPLFPLDFLFPVVPVVPLVPFVPLVICVPLVSLDPPVPLSQRGVDRRPVIKSLA